MKLSQTCDVIKDESLKFHRIYRKRRQLFRAHMWRVRNVNINDVWLA